MTVMIGNSSLFMAVAFVPSSNVLQHNGNARLPMEVESVCINQRCFVQLILWRDVNTTEQSVIELLQRRFALDFSEHGGENKLVCDSRVVQRRSRGRCLSTGGGKTRS